MPATAQTAALCGDELLVAVFGQFPPGSSFRITDENDIVDAFYHARQDRRYMHLFANYPFDEDGVEPSSRELSDGLRALQQTRLLGRMNPALINYTISPALKISYDRYIRPRLQGQEQILKELANAIRGELGIKAAAGQ
jgi:hypothetical protein